MQPDHLCSTSVVVVVVAASVAYSHHSTALSSHSWGSMTQFAQFSRHHQVQTLFENNDDDSDDMLCNNNKLELCLLYNFVSVLHRVEEKN
jgi:hypothetical protein